MTFGSERPEPARLHQRPHPGRGNEKAPIVGASAASRLPGFVGPPRKRAVVAQRVFQACAVSGTAVGLAVLLGWAFHIVALKSVAVSMVATKPNAALAFALTGAALLLLEARSAARGPRAAGAMILAGVVGAIGVLTLAEYAFGVDLGIDQLLFHEPARAVGTSAPGRMAVSTATSFVLMSFGLAFVVVGRAMVEQVLAGAALGYALSALLSFLYGAEAARPPGTTKVSALSVVGFLFLGAALLLARPEEGAVGGVLRDEPGGLMARWLLGIGAVIFPLVGAARLAGEHMRLYSASSGVGIMVIASLVAWLAAVAVTANRLNALGRQRTATLGRLRRSEGRLRRTLDHLVTVQETERRGLAMDLHDDTLPALAAVNLQVELAAQRCSDPDACLRLERATQELRATTARLRHLTFDLLPDALAGQGLGGALRHRLERMQELSGIGYELRDHVGASMASHSAAILYRSAVEALRNVARHAEADSVVVTIEHDDDRVSVTIADNGIGIGPPPPESGHMGLTMIRDRAELAGGGMQVSSQPGVGTSVTVWVPSGLSTLPARD